MNKDLILHGSLAIGFALASTCISYMSNFAGMHFSEANFYYSHAILGLMACDFNYNSYRRALANQLSLRKNTSGLENL